MMADREREPVPSINTPGNETKGIKTLKTWREMPPTHYMLKIESFSSLVRILKKTGSDNYESTVFEASGLIWKLVLYLGVEEESNGSISLQLKIMDPRVWEITAFPIFFIYNQLRDKFLSIQDMELRQFNNKKESEVYQLVPVRCFRNPSNGYLINDSCVFGVEVFVLRVYRGVYRGAARFVTRREQNEKVYTWNVEKFSELKETGHFSEPFYVGDYKWKFHLYNKGIPKVKGKYMSIFLCLQEHAEFPSGWKMYVGFKLAINDQVNKNKSEKIVKTGNAWFSDSDDAWGFPRFIKLADLRSEGLVLRDAMQIELQIISISMTETF